MTSIGHLLLSSVLSLAPMAGISAQEHLFDEVTYTPDSTVFRLNTDPRTREVRVLVTDGAEAGAPVLVDGRMHRVADGRWRLAVARDLKDKYYVFRVSAEGLEPTARPVTHGGYYVSPGVFAKAVAAGGRVGAIVDLRETDPDGWASDRRPPLSTPADLVIYEMHHRDFSVSPSSGLAHKGKYLALTEPRAIDHLTRLGINAVHLLPSFDFASIDETRPDSAQYNWGYDPLNYNVPEGSYSTDARDPKTRIREFKLMVQALHRAGIRVILDVVYNHTFDIAGSNFQLTYPDYYYRKTADGRYSDGSGCGNETASERPLMREFMVESMRYWATEYHIDGFRVDLMGVHDIETMNTIARELRAIDPTLFVYGEGWSAGQCAYPTEQLAVKANTHRLDGIAAFSDDLRDALRGPFSDDTRGAFLAGEPGSEESVKYGIAGAIAHDGIDMSRVNYSREPWAAQPTQMISYVSCHDDMCLTDRLRASIPSLTDTAVPERERTAELIRLDLLAQTAVMTSQGVPFMLAGEEMLRDKKGVHNSYCSPDSVNAIDWSRLATHPEVFAYYSRLIAMRRAHPAFRLATAERVRRHLEFLPGGDCLVAFRLKDLDGIDAWKDIVVVLNASREPRRVALPEGKYRVVCRDGVIDEHGLGDVSGAALTVSPQSAMILHTL